MPEDDVFTLYYQACDKVDRGDLDGARKLLKGHPQFLIGLENKIRPITEEAQVKELKRMAQVAAFLRGRAWVYQLEATGVCHYSRKLLKDPLFRLSDFLERLELDRNQQAKMHSMFFEFYFAEIGPVSNTVRTSWDEYKKKKSKVRFKDFIKLKVAVEPQEFSEPQKILSRYERPWVI